MAAVHIDKVASYVSTDPEWIGAAFTTPQSAGVQVFGRLAEGESEYPVVSMSGRMSEGLVVAEPRWGVPGSVRLLSLEDAPQLPGSQEFTAEQLVAKLMVHMAHCVRQVRESGRRVEQLELDRGEFAACVCGNTSASDGFYPYHAGAMVSADADGLWEGVLYCCFSCLRVIDQYSGVVMEHPVSVVLADVEAFGEVAGIVTRLVSSREAEGRTAD